MLFRITQYEQVNVPADGNYKAPFVPFLSAIGIYFNFVLAWEASFITWINLALYSGVGAAIYFFYGVKNSKAG